MTSELTKDVMAEPTEKAEWELAWERSGLDVEDGARTGFLRGYAAAKGKRCDSVSDQGLHCARDEGHSGGHHALGEHLPGVAGSQAIADGEARGAASRAPSAELEALLDDLRDLRTMALDGDRSDNWQRSVFARVDQIEAFIRGQR